MSVILERPSTSITYLTRLEIQLIDMHNMSDGEYVWILYTQDYYTKFAWAYPFKSKEVALITEKLLQQFYLFGAPQILQSLNEKELFDEVIKVRMYIYTSFFLFSTLLFIEQFHLY